MPTYDFRCKKCGHTFERSQGMNDPNPRCPKEIDPGHTAEMMPCCDHPTEKLITGAAAVHFQGSGWAKDGYSK